MSYPIPDIRFSSPQDFIPKSPPANGKYKLNTASPLARGLEFLVVPHLNGGRCFVTGNLPTKSGTYSVSPRGVKFTSGSNGVWNYPVFDGISSAAQRTLFGIGSPNTATDDCHLITAADNAVARDYVSLAMNPGDYFVYYHRDGGNTWSLGGNPTNNNKYSMLGVSYAANSHELFVDGSSFGTSTATVTPDNIDNISIGSVQDSSPGYGQVEVECGMFWSRPLTSGEINTLFQHPYTSGPIPLLIPE